MVSGAVFSDVSISKIVDECLEILSVIGTGVFEPTVGHWWGTPANVRLSDVFRGHCLSLVFIPPATKLGGYIGFTLSVRPSVRPSVCSLTFRVHPVASTVQDGFFPYLVQMINSMKWCVACDDPWPWSISSRSFGLDLENCVRSVASTVLDGFFLYLGKMITIIRGCVACYFFFRIWKFEFLANFKKISALTLKKKSTVLNGFFPYLAQMITSMRGCVAYNGLWPWPISSRSFGLGLENRVRSVASTVPDGVFPYVVQMITSMRCVTCDDLDLNLQGLSTLT